MVPSTQEYVAVITDPPIIPLGEFQTIVATFQTSVARYGAELGLELAPLQQAVLDETDPALTQPLGNAYQRTQFLQSRVDRLSALLQEIRVGLIDLATDQAAVIAAAPPA